MWSIGRTAHHQQDGDYEASEEGSDGESEDEGDATSSDDEIVAMAHNNLKRSQ